MRFSVSRNSAKEVEKEETEELNFFEKSMNSFKEIGQDVWHGFEDRADKMLDSPYDFVNYLTIGLPDGVKGIWEGEKSEVKGQQFTNGRKNRLKPNIRYQTGEFDYFYETDSAGRISKFETDNLQLTKRENRLSHSRNTLGKVKGKDHAGHLAGDRFGGSPKIDNLVSQLSDVNLRQYKKIEEVWATALKEVPPKKVTVDVEVVYSGKELRPEKFKIKYTIDDEFNSEVFIN